MKKIVIVSLAVLMLAGLTIATNAACAASKSVVNTFNAGATGLSSTPANVRGFMWVYGNGAAVNSGASAAAVAGGASCEFVGATTNCYYEWSGCWAGGPSYGVYAGDLSSAAEWATGCPANGDRIVVLLQDTTGKYAIFSKIGSAGTWDLDAVPVQAAAIPALTITRTSATGVSPAVFTVNLTGLPANGNGGFAPADGAPATPLITGYEIYYQNAAAPPSGAYSASWTLCTGGTIAGATTASQANVQAPLPGVGNTYLLLRPTFESGFKADYGVVYTSFGPTAAGVIAGANATQNGSDVTVSWQSNVESNVATYEVYWATMKSGPFRLVSTSAISPKGDNQSYTVTFANPTMGPRPIFAKVRAVKTDGTFEESPVMQVGGSKAPSSGDVK